MITVPHINTWHLTRSSPIMKSFMVFLASKLAKWATITWTICLHDHWTVNNGHNRLAVHRSEWISSNLRLEPNHKPHGSESAPVLVAHGSRTTRSEMSHPHYHDRDNGEALIQLIAGRYPRMICLHLYPYRRISDKIANISHVANLLATTLEAVKTSHLCYQERVVGWNSHIDQSWRVSKGDWFAFVSI